LSKKFDIGGVINCEKINLCSLMLRYGSFLLILVCIIYIVCAIIMLRRTEFEVVIKSDPIKAGIPALEIGMSNLELKRKKNVGIRVVVSRAVAYDIQNKLGAIVLNIQQGNRQ